MRFFWINLIFCLIAASTLEAAVEKLRYRQQSDGEWRLFIENAQEDAEQYTVELISLNKDELESTVSGFKASLMKGILEGELSTTSLPEGVYYLNLNREGVSVGGAKPTRLIWDNEYLTQSVRVDRRNSVLRWKPATPCLARIVAVLPSGMTVDVVSGWKFYSAQDQVLEYDFVGDDGRNLQAMSNLSIFAQYITLPLNTFVQGQPEFEAYASMPLFRNLELPRDPLSFEFSTNAKLLNEDTGVYRGKEDTSITVKLDAETNKRLSGKRFEILIYLDGEFVHEEAQGTSPYTYILPTFDATDRPQNISVNVLDYLGNWGTQTLTFQFTD